MVQEFKEQVLIAIDTETTGIDFLHGARSYLVTIADEKTESIRCWEWYVNPQTRQPKWSIKVRKDIKEIQEVIEDGAKNKGGLVLQNTVFDVLALSFLPGWKLQWPWDKTHDTLLAAHLLNTAEPHDLETLAIKYLDRDIGTYNKTLKEVCTEARNLGQSIGWRIAVKGEPDMPSAGGTMWKADAWMPRLIARELDYPEDHLWQRVTRDYANVDSWSTLGVFKAQRPLIEKRGLWSIYEWRLKLLPIIYDMRRKGISVSKSRMDALYKRLEQEYNDCAATCTNVAKLRYDYDLELPKGSVNGSLSTLIFDKMKLPVLKQNKTGPGIDKNVLELYGLKLPRKSKEGLFVRSLITKNNRGSALSYIKQYRRHWVSYDADYESGRRYSSSYTDWYTLHSELNPTGTKHLRWSSKNPNEQNVSKQEERNLREGFGPRPNREFFCLDAENLEIRIPAFESGEKELIEVFNNPDKPPYYGSYHLVVFDILHPKLFREHGKACKKLFASTWYQWVKNGNFAIIYGAQEAKADATYKVAGAYKLIQRRFPRMSQLSRKMLSIANRFGGIETIPDKSISPHCGYPILCKRSKTGGIVPTTPLNYHVSGTAMWWMCGAMIRCYDQLQQWRQVEDFDGFITLQVHDELVFDFPKSTTSPQGILSNLPKVLRMRELMVEGGQYIGVPTPVSISYHPNNWAKEAEFKRAF